MRTASSRPALTPAVRAVLGALGLAPLSTHARLTLLARALYTCLDATDDPLVAVPRPLLEHLLGELGYATRPRCHHCGTRIVGSQRRRHCSDACRAHAYRQRQRQAHVLLTQGHPLPEIARALRTDLTTLQGWLAHPPPGPGPRGRRRRGGHED